MAASFELFPQLSIVVNLAIENDPRRSIRIMDRLMAALQIDNREAAHREADAGAKIKSVVIRSSMADRVVHAGEQFAVYLRAITANNACYSTHLNLMMKS